MEIQKTHKLARGLVACLMMNEAGGVPRDLLPQEAIAGTPTTVTGAQWTIGASGSGMAFAASSDVVTEPYDARFNVGGVLSIVARVNSTSASATQIVTSRNYNGSNVPWLLSPGGVGAYTGIAFFNGGWATSGATTDIRGDGRDHTLGGSFDTISASTPMDYYIDGVLDKHTDLGATIWANNTNDLHIGRFANDGVAWVGTIYFVYIYNRVLAASEFLQLHADPYCFLRPKVRLADVIFTSPTTASGAAAGMPLDRYFRNLRVA